LGVVSRGTRKRIGSASSWDGLTQLIIVAICFAVGSVSGFLFSVSGGENPELLDYLQQYFRLMGAENGFEPPLLDTIWDLVRWPLAAFLLGLTPVGAVGVPLIMGGRGFLLSYAATTFVRLFHLPGMVVVLAVFGVTVFLAVPTLFVVAADAFRQSLSRLPGAMSSPIHWTQRARALAPCAGLLTLAVALQQTVMPVLFSTVCTQLLII
jgi:hypothetical protein